jgi:hypothetical protein
VHLRHLSDIRHCLHVQLHDDIHSAHQPIHDYRLKGQVLLGRMIDVPDLTCGFDNQLIFPIMLAAAVHSGL